MTKAKINPSALDSCTRQNSSIKEVGTQLQQESVANSAGALFATHWSELLAYVSHRFGAGPPEPEDIVQATFTQFAALKKPGDIDNPRAFLFRTAHNIAINMRRKHQTANRHAQTTAAEKNINCSDDLGPERVLIARQRAMLLEQAIYALPPRKRDLLLMHRVKGLSYAEIARRSGLSQTAVKKHVAQAVAACASALESADASQEPQESVKK